MPTQYQSFPMEPLATREWTEFFTTSDGPLEPAVLSNLLSPDYHGTSIPAADQILEGKSIGGSATSSFEDMDAFLASISDRKVTAGELLHHAVRTTV